MKTAAKIVRYVGIGYLCIAWTLIALGNLWMVGTGQLTLIGWPVNPMMDSIWNIWNLIAIALTVTPGYLLKDNLSGWMQARSAR